VDFGERQLLIVKPKNKNLRGLLSMYLMLRPIGLNPSAE